MEYKYIGEILKHTDLQLIRVFLLHGDAMNIDAIEHDARTYEERLKQGEEKIVKRLEKIAKDNDDLDKIFAEYGDAEEARRDVFFELGMKIGARLLFELLHKQD